MRQQVGTLEAPADFKGKGFLPALDITSENIIPTNNHEHDLWCKA